MDEQSQRIADAVAAPAAVLSRTGHEIARLNRRREFESELKKNGNWLANGSAEPPAWVKPWNEYWQRLEKDPHYIGLRSEHEAARKALHSEEFEAGIERLRLGESGEPAEWAIAYLEADPWYFRSGYFKASLSRWLRQVSLNKAQQDRLRAAMVNNIAKGGRLEFGETRKLARRLDTPAFRKAIEKFLSNPDTGTRERANLLLASCRLNDTPGRDLGGAR